MKRSISPLAFLGKIEGLPVAAVLAALYGVFIFTSPTVFTGYRIYMSSSRGYVLPAGTPKPVVDVLANGIKKVLSSDDHKKRIADMTLALRYMTPEEFGKHWEDFETQIIELSKLIKD